MSLKVAEKYTRFVMPDFGNKQTNIRMGKLLREAMSLYAEKRRSERVKSCIILSDNGYIIDEDSERIENRINQLAHSCLRIIEKHIEEESGGNIRKSLLRRVLQEKCSRILHKKMMESDSVYEETRKQNGNKLKIKNVSDYVDSLVGFCYETALDQKVFFSKVLLCANKFNLGQPLDAKYDTGIHPVKKEEKKSLTFYNTFLAEQAELLAKYEVENKVREKTANNDTRDELTNVKPVAPKVDTLSIAKKEYASFSSSVNEILETYFKDPLTDELFRENEDLFLLPNGKKVIQQADFMTGLPTVKFHKQMITDLKAIIATLPELTDDDTEEGIRTRISSAKEALQQFIEENFEDPLTFEAFDGEMKLFLVPPGRVILSEAGFNQFKGRANPWNDKETMPETLPEITYVNKILNAVKALLV